MNKVEILEDLIKDGESLEAGKQVMPDNTRNPKHPYTMVDEAKYQDWRNRTEKFLTDNSLEGFIEGPAGTMHGNYYLFKPQFKQLKQLKTLNDYLGIGLNFKTADISKYLLRIFGTISEFRSVCAVIDLLGQAVGTSDLNEVLQQMELNGWLNMNISFGANGDAMFNLRGNSYLTIRGREVLIELQKEPKTQKPRTAVKRVASKTAVKKPASEQKVAPVIAPRHSWIRRNYKWLIASVIVPLIAGAIGLTIYIQSNNVKQENKASFHGATINGPVIINQANDTQIKTDAKVTK